MPQGRWNGRHLCGAAEVEGLLSVQAALESLLGRRLVKNPGTKLLVVFLVAQRTSHVGELEAQV